MNQFIASALLAGLFCCSCASQCFGVDQDEIEEYLNELSKQEIAPAERAQRVAGYLEGKLNIRLPLWWIIRLVDQESFVPYEVENTNGLDVVDENYVREYARKRLSVRCYQDIDFAEGELFSCIPKNRERLRHLPSKILVSADRESIDSLHVVSWDREIVALPASSSRFRVVSLRPNGEVNWDRELSFDLRGPTRAINGRNVPNCIEVVATGGNVMILYASVFHSLLAIIDREGNVIASCSVFHFEG